MDRKKILIIVGIIITLVLVMFVVFLFNSRKTITYNVSFETNGGSSIKSQIINKGEKAIKPVDPTKDDYVFVQWTYKGNAYDFNSVVTSDLILEAEWVELKGDVETFIVKFDSDGGTTISNQLVEKGERVAKPIDPIKDGYEFKGWTLNDEIYDFLKEVKENIVLKAKWEKNINNNTSSSDTNNKGNTNVSNNGNNNTNNGGNTTNSTQDNKPEVKKYTVSFNSDGGSAVNSQTIIEGGKVSKPSNPTRKGYTFAGWTFNGREYDFNSSVKANFTLVARWNENAKVNYTVAFDSNGGSGVGSQTVTEGSNAIRPSNPTKDGFNFGGWLLNGSEYNFNTAVNSNITLVAKWNQKSYVVRVSSIDQYSPDRLLAVYEDGTPISVSAVKYNGVTLCSGSNMVVNMYEISGVSSLTVVLTGGSSVTASVQQ